MSENKKENDGLKIQLTPDTTITKKAEEKKETKKPTTKKAEPEDVAFEEIKDTKNSSETKSEEKKEETKPTPAKKRTTRKSGRTKKDEKPETKTVNVDDLEPEKKETVEVDFMSGDFANDFISQQTKKSEMDDEPDDLEVPDGLKDKSAEEVREQIKQEEDDYANALNTEDYYEIASLLVDFLDMIVSASLKWYAKDSSDEAYSLSKVKKKRVATSLAYVLIKHQRKISIELMFIIALLSAYSGPFMAAKSRRKVYKETGKAPERGKGKPRKN